MAERIKLTIEAGKVAADHWFESTVDDAWVIAYRLIVSADRTPRIAELRVFPVEPRARRRRVAGTWSGDAAAVPGIGITSAVVRAVKLSEPVRRLFDVLGAESGLLDAAGLARSTRPEPASPAVDGGVRRGRKPHDDMFLATVAQQYVEAFKAGLPPVQHVADAHGATVTRARGWIHQARERQFLLGRGQGRSGGELSPLAMQALGSRIPRGRQKGRQR